MAPLGRLAAGHGKRKQGLTERLDDRQTDLEALARWGAARMGFAPENAALDPVSGDASFRRYYRLRCGDERVVLCDAPPAKEKNAEFVAIAGALQGGGVRVPRVFGADLERGWLCIEDLGDQLLLPLLNAGSVDGYYGEALAMLARLATIDPGELDLPVYDRAELEREMGLFPEWFCAGLIEHPLDEEATTIFRAAMDALCDRALAQPRVLVHRDYHARNLMLPPGGGLAAIDFQDAILGPPTYDAVSLLRDCYIRWPDDRVRDWALSYRDRLLGAGVAVAKDDAAFLADFDCMGLQRHIKVLGIFARLWLRDGKEAYLGDLPRVLDYTRDVLAARRDIPALAAFRDWLEAEIVPRALAQPWYRAP
jgi:aminoglycoside/choline kinase family phosphotransferase